MESFNVREMNNDINGYILIRDWFNFTFENPDKTNCTQTALYCYIIDLWNRLGQKERFGLPTYSTMECLNIKSYKTYKKTLDSLIEFGFVKIISKSINQHQSNIVGIVKNTKASTKALDKAHTKASTKAHTTIIEQRNNRTIEQTNDLFDSFWDLYDKKVGDKNKLIKKWADFDSLTISKIMQHVANYKLSQPTKKYRKDPATYFNNRSWEDEVINLEPAKPIIKNIFADSSQMQY